MKGAVLPAIVMACCGVLALATEMPFLRCPHNATRDQCEEIRHDRFRLNKDTGLEFFYEAEHFIRLECAIYFYGDDMEIQDLEKVSRFLPQFKPALRVHNVTVRKCQPMFYASLFDKLNVTLVTPFNLELYKTGQKELLTAAHFADLPLFRHLTLRLVHGDLNGMLPASLESLTVEFTSLLDSTILEELPLTLTKLRLVKVNIERVPAAVLNLPELRSLYVEHDKPREGGFVMVERGNASQLEQFHVVGTDSALLSEWVPPVLKEVTLKYWQAEIPAPVPTCEKLVKLTLYHLRVLDFPTGWVTRCPHLKELHIEEANYVWKLPEPAGFLQNATHLTSFSIRRTPLSSLPEHLFANTSNLTHLDLSHNQFVQLQPHLFANTLKLTHLDLSYNKLKQLQPQLFVNTPNLTHLRLSYNKLTQLQKQLFANTLKLTYLDLSDNKLIKLQPLLFANTTHLTYLGLKDNQLIQLPSSMLKLPLLSLDLDYNLLNASVVAKLAVITELRSLSLKGNKGLGDLCSVNDSIVPVYKGKSSLASLLKLESLDMQATNVSVICSDWLEDMVNLTHLDLRSTRIVNLTYEDLQYRRRVPAEVKVGGTIYFTADDYDRAVATGVVTPLSRNVNVTTSSPYSCNLYWMTKALNDDLLPLYDVLIYRNPSLRRVSAEDLLCPRNQTCANVPAVCKCGMTGDGLLRIICIDVNLNRVPQLQFLNTDVHPVDLVLPINSITELIPEDLPPQLRVLDLRNNSLRYITEATARALVSGVNRRVLLAGNPLECLCSAAPALRVLRDHAAVLVGYDALRCEDGGTLEDAIDACWTFTATVTTASLPTVTAIMLALYLWWKWNILFGHTRALLWRLGWRSRDERNAAWTLDAFVVFGRGDESLALEVTARLEHGARARRVSLAERDWLPPARVSECIALSTSWARRTVALVSREWERSLEEDEIRAAYAPTLGRGALVLVLPSAGELKDAALRRYATDYPHLVLHRDAPNFWGRLKRAVPPAPSSLPMLASSPMLASPPTSTSPSPSEYIQLVPLNQPDR